MRATVQHNGEKFRELLVCVAAKTGDDSRFGDIKVNKVLWWSDFRALQTMKRRLGNTRRINLTGY
jgi:hypothetical protein